MLKLNQIHIHITHLSQSQIFPNPSSPPNFRIESVLIVCILKVERGFGNNEAHSTSENTYSPKYSMITLTEHIIQNETQNKSVQLNKQNMHLSKLILGRTCLKENRNKNITNLAEFSSKVGKID